MKHILTLLLLVTFSISSFSQVDEFSEDVKTIVKLDGTMIFYENAVNQMFGMLKQQYTSKKVPESIWEEFEKSKNSHLEELSQMLVTPYKLYFKQEDLKNLLAFYKTETAQQMVSDSSKLSENQKKEIGDFYNSKTGQKKIASMEDFNASMSRIVEIWSSDIYRTIVHSLKEKGYEQ